MHDRFGTLESVLNHYSSALLIWPTLDPILKQNGKLESHFLKQKNTTNRFLKNINRQSISY
jgi:hypothetical protein